MNFPPSSYNHAVLLVIHGSRDPRPGQAVENLAKQVSQIVGKHCLIESAYLEFAERPLHQQIMDFGDRALQLGCQSLNIIPLFLSPGVHVREDIPDEVALAQNALGDVLAIKVLPYLGSDPNIVNLLEQRLSALRCIPGAISSSSATPVILMAHGSRRPGGNRPIEYIATHLGAIPAYWSVTPQLPEQIQTLAARGYKRIIVIPYFLFAGGITDAITKRVVQFKFEHSTTTVILGNPLGTKSDIVALIAQKIDQEIRQDQQNLVTSITLKY